MLYYLCIGGFYMEVLITSINHNGDGIGKIDGKVIFVPKTVIGDMIKVKDVVEYKNYYNGEVDEFLLYGSDRCEIECSYYDKCGGCQIMGLNYDKQLEYKKDKVVNIFKKYSNLDINPDIVGSSLFRYRNKITLQVVDGKIGYFRVNSNDLVQIDKCLLVSDRMNKVISIIRDNFCLGNVDKIMLRDCTGGVAITFFGEIDNVDASIFDGFVSSIYVNDDRLYGSEADELLIGNYRFVVSSNSFFQVNIEQTFRLYNYVKECVSKDSKVLDLYCGVGSIGIFCADKCRSVVGVEINDEAIRCANMNKKINGVDNISFKCLNANRIDYKENDFDVVIVDPPRGGLDKKTIDIINRIRSKVLIYVSCNPVTLARDVNVLMDSYNMISIKLFDMFPNTYHVESVMWLCLKK